MISVEDVGAIRLFTLRAPERRNALGPRASAELSALIDAFEADPRARVAILTGEGNRAFCAGGDLADTDDTPLPPTGFGGLTARFDRTKPIIAAVNGTAFGGGFELALACDIIVADEGAARFALPEPRVGLAALAGGLQRLPRLIGEKAALGLILTADTIDAREAHRLGLVYRLAVPGEVVREAIAVAERIVALSPAALRASKEAVTLGLRYASLAEAMAAQADFPTVRAMLEGPERREGIRAFRQKRPPAWAIAPEEQDVE